MTIPNVVEMMMNYLRVEPKDALKKIKDNKGCHARFEFLENMYAHHLAAVVQVNGDDERVMYHKTCVLRSYIMLMHLFHSEGIS